MVSSVAPTDRGNRAVRAIIGCLACLVAVGPGASSAHRADRKTSPTGSTAQNLVLIVLDGARPDYFSESGLPHLRALQRSGATFTSAWAGILESVTPAGHASITSGSEPRSTGILGFGWPDTTTGRWISLYPEDRIRAGLLDHLLRRARVPTIAQRVHDADPGARVVALGGYKFYANDTLAGPDADVVLYYADRPHYRYAPRFMPGHAPPLSLLHAPGVVAATHWSHLRLGQGNHLAMGLAMAALKTMHQRVTLINLPEFDMPLGHVFGASRDPAGVRLLMRGFDRDLGRLEATLRAQGMLDHTLFVITADHGFAPLDHSIPEEVIRKALRRAGTDMVHDVYETGTYLWLRDPHRAIAAGRSLAASLKKWAQSIYVRHPAGALTYTRVFPGGPHWNPGVDAANRYLLRSFMGRHAPDVVIFFREGSAAHLHGRPPWRGDHGGADWEAQHIPLVLSGPGVRPGVVLNDPVRVIDIAPTVLTLMGASPAGMDGIPAASALQNPSDAASGAWHKEEAKLEPLITALARESVRERGN